MQLLKLTLLLWVQQASAFRVVPHLHAHTTTRALSRTHSPTTAAAAAAASLLTSGPLSPPYSSADIEAAKTELEQVLHRVVQLQAIIESCSDGSKGEGSASGRPGAEPGQLVVSSLSGEYSYV